MSLTLFEFTILGLHLAMITFMLVLIQLYNPGAAMRQAMTIEDKGEPFVEPEFEEPDSDSEPETKAPFNPEEEDFTMTENPMLRNRNAQKEPVMMEMVD